MRLSRVLQRKILPSLIMCTLFAGGLAASASAAATKLVLETPNLGKLKGDELIYRTDYTFVPAGHESIDCVGEETFGELTTNESAKDLASWEPASACGGTLRGNGTVEMTGKKKASLFAPKGKKLGVFDSAEECLFEASKLKGSVENLEPVEVHVTGTLKLNKKVLHGAGCPSKATFGIRLSLLAAEPPFREFEEPVKGKLLA